MATGLTNAGALPVSQNQTVPESPTTHKVIFIDPFGVVNEQWVEDGTNAILPTPRVHEYLTFVEWNQSTENITEDMVVGAIYDTSDGKTYAFITLTAVTGLDLVLYLNKSDGSTLTVNWGDGTISTFTNSGIFNTGTHTYQLAGDYSITLWISNGAGTYKLGDGSNSFIGGVTQLKKNTLTSIFIGNGVNALSSYCFQNNWSLKFVVINYSVTEIGTYLFTSNYNLKILILTNSINTIFVGLCANCCSLEYLIFPNNIQNIPNDITNNCYLLKLSNSPSSVISIGNNAFIANYSRELFVFPFLVTTIGANILASNFTLKKVVVQENVTSMTAQRAFENCYSVKIYIFYPTTPPVLGYTNTFNGINPLCKIYVPDASVTAYKTATNWVIYANYIYPLSTYVP